MEKAKQLMRKRSEQVIAGVCAGIADYFDIDPTLVRIAFVLFTVMGGSGIIIYILLWIVMPEESAPEATVESRMKSAVGEMEEKAQGVFNSVRPSSAPPDNSRSVALVLIIVGGLFLLRDYGLSFHQVWPIALVIVGILLFYRKR